MLASCGERTIETHELSIHKPIARKLTRFPAQLEFIQYRLQLLVLVHFVLRVYFAKCTRFSFFLDVTGIFCSEAQFV